MCQKYNFKRQKQTYLRENIPQLIHKFPRAHNCQRHLNRKDPDLATISAPEGRQQPIEQNACLCIDRNVLHHREALVQVVIQRRDQRLQLRHTDLILRIERVQSILPERLDHVPNVDQMQICVLLHVPQLARRPIRREPDHVEGVQLKIRTTFHGLYEIHELCPAGAPRSICPDLVNSRVFVVLRCAEFRSTVDDRLNDDQCRWVE